jgi:hypothetical protein
MTTLAISCPTTFCFCHPNMASADRFQCVIPSRSSSPALAQARISLAEFVQDLVLRGSLGSGFTARQISYLARVDLRTVRNAMGPKGDRPIRTIRVANTKRRHFRRSARCSRMARRAARPSIRWPISRMGQRQFHEYRIARGRSGSSRACYLAQRANDGGTGSIE